LDWPNARKELVKSNIDYITTLYSANNYGAGIGAAQRLLERQKSLLGEGHIDTALARGVLAVGLARSGKNEEALDAFKLAIPIIVATSRETDMDDALQTVVRDTRVAFVIDQYMRLLSQHGTDAAVRESFRLGDTIRGRSVQNAVAASSARAAIRDPLLADLARRSQDLDKQLVARFGVLNGALALPSQDRDPAALKSLQDEIQKLRAERDRARRELGQRSRNYASLTEPEAASVEDVQAALHDNEAFVSFYFGREASFAWGVPKTGVPVFHALKITAEEVDAKVRKLREPMEQDDLSPIAPFDVALAHELYAELLRPLETAWRSAKSLVVATNSMLGLLPLGVLPVEAWAGQGGGQSDDFAHYRDVAWLARTHAVTIVPSAASLSTLRKLSPSSAQRDAFIGFGDPVFSKEQATEPSKVASVDTRGRAVSRRSAVRTTQEESAELARLPRLPDTADELRAVAELLGADPAKSVILGKDANEKRVKATDLAKFRVVAFATHGLLPGDLDGLTQPALALSAPSVADIDGDGLLTMEEVLALKLDADWVLLSACNTATGANKGAEAISGLGRSFFYAGTRALLVTNWAVHSASARDLVTDIFRQKAANLSITRAEALRLAMLRLMDGPGYRDGQGKASFTYAHPLFWAPYSLVGNGGH
jgi:CHAT domain-containing protein